MQQTIPDSVDGTTSACAENTYGGPQGGFHPGNYLRVRGEYVVVWLGWGFRWELPPRARRIHRCYVGPRMILGTTSACAENTKTPISSPFPKGNYLRVRGEYLRNDYMNLEQKELPPRARRIRRTPPQARSLIGTTSACAENTSTPLPCEPEKRNYLRVRGEYPK